MNKFYKIRRPLMLMYFLAWYIIPIHFEILFFK